MATRGFSVAGLMTSKVRDASASTHSPSMSNWVGRSEGSERSLVIMKQPYDGVSTLWQGSTFTWGEHFP